MDRGLYVSRTKAESTTLKDVIERYIAEVCPTKRGGLDEAIRLCATCRTKLAKLSMAVIAAKDVAAYRDERLRQVKPGTVIRELEPSSRSRKTGQREQYPSHSRPQSCCENYRDPSMAAYFLYSMQHFMPPSGKHVRGLDYSTFTGTICVIQP